MPWLKMGDDSAHHPRLMSIYEYEGYDDRLMNEVFGFLVRCAVSSAGFLTDYVITRGVAIQMSSPERVDALVATAVHAQLLSPCDYEGRAAWKIVDDDPDFIHIRLREEIEWEKQRKQDNSNPAITIPVRVRDGDACRYCGRVVTFTARKGGKRGTYDHRVPGEAGTVGTIVVACHVCNAERGNRADADDILPLLPEPSNPYYSAETVAWINNHDWAQRNGISLPNKKMKHIPVGDVAPCHREHISVQQVLSYDNNDSLESSCPDTPCQEKRAESEPLYSHKTSEAHVHPVDAPHSCDDSGDVELRGIDRHKPAESVARASTVASEPQPESKPLSKDVVRGIERHEPAVSSARASKSPYEESLDSGCGSTARGIEQPIPVASSARVPQESIRAPRHNIASSLNNGVLPAVRENLQIRAEPAERGSTKSGFSGSGRDGSGRAGLGLGIGRDRAEVEVGDSGIRVDISTCVSYTAMSPPGVSSEDMQVKRKKRKR